MWKTILISKGRNYKIVRVKYKGNLSPEEKKWVDKTHQEEGAEEG